MIDLHAHTTASDGQYPPAEVVARAHGAGVRHLAVTDHDTVDGLQAAQAAAAALGMELICGIEISTRIAGVDIHVLGHFLRPDHPALLAYTRNQMGERRRRMERMVRKLNALGTPVTMAQVEEMAGGDNLCRPHLARALVAMGACRSVQDAFTRLIGDGGPGWSDQERLEAKDAIAVIRDAGGTATLAHPSVDGMNRWHIGKLAEVGLSGLEVFHPSHDEGQRVKYLKIARALDLVATSGSDFHGEKVAPDQPFGTSVMEASQLAALRARARVSL
jgi:predicted metal-dependent phosphoesterase TrpH